MSSADMSAVARSTFIAICYFLFTFGYTISKGFYHVGELAIIITTCAILFFFYFKPKILEKLNIPKSQDVLIFTLGIIAVANVAQMGASLGDSAQTNWLYFSALNRILAFCALIIAISYFLKKLSGFLEKYRILAMVAIAMIIRIFSVVSAPSPTIDVFYILRDGPKLLLESKNPYELSYEAPYGVYIPKIIFVYGPLVPFIFLPSVLIFNDPRYTLIVADLLSAFLLYKIANKIGIAKTIREQVVIIFLFHPLFPFMTEQSWLEPIITFLFISAIYLLTTQKKSVYGAFFLGLILAIKSVYILPFFTLLFNLKSQIKKYIVLLAVPILITLPFLLADSKLFLDRTQTYVTDPKSIAANLAPTEISLNIAALVLKYTRIVLPSVLVLLLGLIAAAAVILKGSKDMATTVLSSFLVFIVLFMFGPFIYLHYYAFLGNILLLVLILTFAKNHAD